MCWTWFGVEFGMVLNGFDQTVLSSHFHDPKVEGEKNAFAALGIV